MTEQDKWLKVRQIVREEVEAGEERLLEKFAALLKKSKPKIELVNGKWIGITEEQREAWGAAYGAVDLEAELKRAAAWCVSNPSLAPKSQIGRFLNTWLTRQQNQNSLRSIPARSPVPDLCEYCLRRSVGSVNGRRHCDEHQRNAMDNERPPKMPGLVAKPVSGA